MSLSHTLNRVRRWSTDNLAPPMQPAAAGGAVGAAHSRSPSPLGEDALAPLNLYSSKHRGEESTRCNEHDESLILTLAVAEEIRLLLPPRLQICDAWVCMYSLLRDGVSLRTLYDACGGTGGVRRAGYVLVVRDSAGGVFGAYLSHAPRISGHYYGTGECFLWNTKGMGKHGLRFTAALYGGINEYFIYGESTFLSIGGGDGRYGLWLGESFERGESATCVTFGNEPLSEEGRRFDIVGVELWRCPR